MLTAFGDELDKVRGLRAGADDFVTKPFGRHELVARVEALLRRGTRFARAQPEIDVYMDGALTVDHVQRIASSGGTELRLTPLEFRLLSVLVRHAGQLLSVGTLLELVWGDEYAAAGDQVKLTVGRLRRKLEGYVDEQAIETVRGFGYRYRAPAGTEREARAARPSKAPAAAPQAVAPHQRGRPPGRAGRTIDSAAPAGGSPASRRPPCSSTSPRAIAWPRPAPSRGSIPRARRKRRPRLALTPGGRPGLVADVEAQLVRAGRRLDAHRALPRAPRDRVAQQRRQRHGQTPRVCDRARLRHNVRLESHAPVIGLLAKLRTDVRDELRRRERPRLDAHAPGIELEREQQVVDERPHAVRSTRDRPGARALLVVEPARPRVQQLLAVADDERQRRAQLVAATVKKRCCMTASAFGSSRGGAAPPCSSTSTHAARSVRVASGCAPGRARRCR